MECFIKKVWHGKSPEVHAQFVRFSKGVFPGRAALSLKKGDKIILGGSFEFANDFAACVAELDSNAKFSGIILSRKEIPEFGKAKAKNSIFQYAVADVSSGKIKEIEKDAYAILVDAQAEGLALKTKKKLPKPGKSGNLKIDDKFCQLEADLRYWHNIKESFMLPESKKAKISHTIIVNEVIFDKNEKDFSKMRESARKKGRIIRKMQADKSETSEEREFEA